MKLNIIEVLNKIATEEATVVTLNDPEAVWNLPNNENDLYQDYLYYKMDIEMENDSTIDLIEHCIKYGWECPNIKCEKVLSFDEWLAEENARRAKYMVTSVCPNCPFNCYVSEDVVNKMINTINNNHRDAIELFVKIMTA